MKKNDMVIICDLTGTSVSGFNQDQVSKVLEVFKLFDIPCNVGQLFYEVDKSGNKKMIWGDPCFLQIIKKI